MALARTTIGPQAVLRRTATNRRTVPLSGKENFNVSRLLRLTLLAPDIVEAILDGRQGRDVTLDRLRKSFPIDWAKQLSGL